MKKRSLSQRILGNNQVLFFLAVLISLSIWVYMSTGSSNDTVVTVSKVPIQIDLSDEMKSGGYNTYFSDNDTAYASVTVTGNRKLLGSIAEDDFIVTANASTVDNRGKYELAVSADKKSSINNFQITNCSPSKIEVMVDTESKKDFKIVSKFKYGAKDGLYASVTYSNDTITVTGPGESIRAISKVGAVTGDMENLDASKDFTADIVLYDENNQVLPKTYLTLSAETVKGTVKITPQKTVPVEAEFLNKPPALKIDDSILAIDPEKVSIAGSEEDLDRLFKVKLDAIDFSTLKNQKYNIDSLNLTVPDGYKLIDTTSVIKVNLDLSGFSSKTLTIDKFKVENLAKNFKANVTTNNLKVTFYGPKADLDKLSASKITAKIDASDSGGNAAAQELPVSFDLGDNDTCWAYGSHLASVVVEEK